MRAFESDKKPRRDCGSGGRQHAAIDLIALRFVRAAARGLLGKSRSVCGFLRRGLIAGHGFGRELRGARRDHELRSQGCIFRADLATPIEGRGHLCRLEREPCGTRRGDAKCGACTTQALDDALRDAHQRQQAARCRNGFTVVNAHEPRARLDVA